MIESLERTLSRIRTMPVAPPPEPWRAVGEFSVGGLRGVGFDEGSELLLIESSSDGMILLDCATGERVAHDPEHVNTFVEEVRLLARGIGPLEGQTIRVCGLFGGGLPMMTGDGWGVELIHHDWPNVASVILVPPEHSIWIPAKARGCVKLRETEAPLALGFSHTQQSLILAHSHTIEVWTRAA